MVSNNSFSSLGKPMDFRISTIKMRQDLNLQFIVKIAFLITIRISDLLMMLITFSIRAQELLIQSSHNKILLNQTKQ